MDCPPSCHDLMRRVLDEGFVARTGIAATDAETLIERGFVQSAANKLQRPSRLLSRYLGEQPNGGVRLCDCSAMPTLTRKISRVCWSRLGQLIGIDSTLKRYLERGTEDLPDHPDVFLSNVRGIVNQAFELIWRVRYRIKGFLPSGWRFGSGTTSAGSRSGRRRSPRGSIACACSTL